MDSKQLRDALEDASQLEQGLVEWIDELKHDNATLGTELSEAKASAEDATTSPHRWNASLWFRAFTATNASF